MKMDFEKIIERYRLDELGSVLFRIEEYIKNQISKEQTEEKNDFFNLLLRAVGKSIVSTREVITLCSTGFPDGALSVARNTFEQFIIIAYIESKKNENDFDKLIERYYDDYDVQRFRVLKLDAHEYSLDTNREEFYRNELEKIKQKHSVSIWGEYWWTADKSTFNQLVKCVVDHNPEMRKLLGCMHMMYKRACIAIHASAMGNLLRLGNDNHCIDLGPWDEGQEYSLFLVTGCLTFIIGTLFSEWSIKAYEINERLNMLIKYYLDLIEEHNLKINKGREDLSKDGNK